MNYIKTITIALLVVLGVTLSMDTFAQAPDPPANHGSSGNQTGGNAPIGGGLFIMLGLGIGYAGKKVHGTYKKNN